MVSQSMTIRDMATEVLVDMDSILDMDTPALESFTILDGEMIYTSYFEDHFYQLIHSLFW